MEGIGSPRHALAVTLILKLALDPSLVLNLAGGGGSVSSGEMEAAVVAWCDSAREILQEGLVWDGMVVEGLLDGARLLSTCTGYALILTLTLIGGSYLRQGMHERQVRSWKGYSWLFMVAFKAPVEREGR